MWGKRHTLGVCFCHMNLNILNAILGSISMSPSLLLEVTKENCILGLHFASTGARHISWAFFLIEPRFVMFPRNAGTISSACFCVHTKKQEYQSHLSCGEYMHANVKVLRKKCYVWNFFVHVFEFSSIFHPVISNLFLVCFLKLPKNYVIYIDSNWQLIIIKSMLIN